MKENRVLICSPAFMGYGEEIASSFKRLGYSVELTEYYSKPPNLHKTSFAIFDYIFYAIMWCYSFPSRVYHTKRLLDKLYADKFSVVCIIHGGFFLPSLLRRGSEKLEARFFVWLMDPLKKFPYLKGYSKLKKTILASYDESDCKKHNLVFLPLFCDDYKIAEKHDRFDFAFIGSVDHKRLLAMNDILTSKASYKVYFGGVYPKVSLSRLSVFLFSKRYFLWKKTFINRIHKREEIEEIYASAKCIVNINADRHNGASMRFFEALSAGRAQLIDNTLAKTDYVIALTSDEHIQINDKFTIVTPSGGDLRFSARDRVQCIISLLSDS